MILSFSANHWGLDRKDATWDCCLPLDESSLGGNFQRMLCVSYKHTYLYTHAHLHTLFCLGKEKKNHMVWFCSMQILLQNHEDNQGWNTSKKNPSSRHKFECIYFLSVERRWAFDFCDPRDINTYMGSVTILPKCFASLTSFNWLNLFPLGSSTKST